MIAANQPALPYTGVLSCVGTGPGIGWPPRNRTQIQTFKESCLTIRREANNLELLTRFELAFPTLRTWLPIPVSRQEQKRSCPPVDDGIARLSSLSAHNYGILSHFLAARSTVSAISSQDLGLGGDFFSFLNHFRITLRIGPGIYQTLRVVRVTTVFPNHCSRSRHLGNVIG